MKRLVWFLLLATSCAAQDFAIHNVTHSPKSPKILNVVFESPAPDSSSVVDPSHWDVRCYKGEGVAPQPLPLTSGTHIQNDYSQTRLVVLVLENDLPSSCRIVQTTFLAGSFPTARWSQKGPKGQTGASWWGGIIRPVRASDANPDISISGTVVTSVGSGPVYSIDASGRHSFFRRLPTELAFTGKVKTDSSPKADPDSFRWALNVLRTPSSSRLSQSWDLVGMEFDKEGQAMNFVSAPALIWTRAWPHLNAEGHVRYSLALDLRAGLELGDNFKNSYSIANRPGRNGSGFFLRGVPAAQLFVVIPTSNPKRGIRFTSAYSVRLPARDELFLETRLGTKDPVPVLGTSPRHYVENNLIFKVTDYFGFKIQHLYGSLPPAFKFTNHQVSIGLAFQAMQAKP